MPGPPTSRGTEEESLHPWPPLDTVIHPHLPAPTHPPNADHSLYALKRGTSLNHLRPNEIEHYIVRQGSKKSCFNMGFFVEGEVVVRGIVE